MTELTVGDLRRKIADLPDDMPVLIIDHHDEGQTVNTAEVSPVKELPNGNFATWLRLDELYEADDVFRRGYTEQDLPPADAIDAFTLWR